MDYSVPEVTSAEREFYGENLILLEGAISEFLSCMDMIRRYEVQLGNRDPVASSQTRIKSAESTSRFLLQGNQDSLRPFPVLFFAAVGPQDSIQQRSKDASNACKEPRTRGDGAGIGGAACIAAVQPCSGSAYQR